MTGKQVIALMATAGVLLVPATALAQEDQNRITTDPIGFSDQGVDEFAGTAESGATGGGLFGAIRRIVNAFLGLAALVAAVFIVIAGVRYITSGGDEDAAASAKNAIIYALIGLVIILLSAVLVNFVIGIFPLA